MIFAQSLRLLKISVSRLMTRVGVGYVLSTLLYILLSTGPLFAEPLSNRDVNLSKQAIDYIKKNQFTKARSLTAKLKSKDARSLMQWMILVEPKSKITFEEASTFLNTHPGWPRAARIKIRLEEILPPSMAPSTVLDWFERHPPASTEGKIRYAEALLAVGQQDAGKAAIRDVWINGRFTNAQFSSFYRRHRAMLSHDDHVTRLDKLIWAGRHRQARRMLYRVNKDERALAEARILLMRMEGNVDAAIAKVPSYLKNDAGLAYERLRWRRKKGRDASARELLQSPPTELRRPDKWWRERRYFARDALNRKDYVEAYLLAINHGLQKPGQNLAEAEWFSGWVALRYLNMPENAIEHFTKMFKAVQFPISRARGAYWLARALDANDRKAEANAWFKTAARYPFTYYGQLGWAKAYGTKPLSMPSDPALPPNLSVELQQHPLTAQTLILKQLGEEDRLRPFVQELANSKEDPAWKAIVAKHAGRLGRPDLGIKFAKLADRKGVSVTSALFPELTPPPIPGPKKTVRDRKDLEVPLVLGLIRQESLFRPRAVSRANARGLMQIIPGTAYAVSKQLGIGYSKQKLLEDPAYNMRIGQAYLAGLLEDFDGSYVLALAAYNAGPARARNWVKRFGNPASPEIDAIDWVESIPFSETRNYVQRVLESTQVYRSRLQSQEVTMSLAKDLER